MGRDWQEGVTYIDLERIGSSAEHCPPPHSDCREQAGWDEGSGVWLHLGLSTQLSWGEDPALEEPPAGSAKCWILQPLAGAFRRAEF